MEFNEQTYCFITGDPDDCYSHKECKIVLDALQNVLSTLTQSEGAVLAKELEKVLKEGEESFLQCIANIWATLRSENGIVLHFPVSLLDSLTMSVPGSQQESLKSEEVDLRFCLKLDGDGKLFLKRRDGSACFPLQRITSNVHKEEEWLPYVLTSISRLFNGAKEKLVSTAAISWSPGLTKYAGSDLAGTQKSRQCVYTLINRVSKAYPVVVYTREAIDPVSERTIYELSQTGKKENIKKLAQLIENYQLTMKKRRNRESIIKRFDSIGKKTVPLPGNYYSLTTTFLPCIAGLQSLKVAIENSMKSDNDSEDEYRISISNKNFTVMSDYNALKEKLKKMVRKRKHELENKKSLIHSELSRSGQSENTKKLIEKHSEKKEGGIVSIPSITQIETAKMPARKILPDKLSQLKAISMTHTILDHPIHQTSQTSSIVREKVAAAVKEQVQMEVAVRTVYNPPDRTAELATLISKTRQGGASRLRIIEQLTPNIRSIMDARRCYLHKKLKVDSSQHAAMELWDSFHNDIMPPNIFAELLLSIETDLESYTFYGIFRDIVYNMYLGMDTRGYLQLLCTSVQSYFSYELYAESIENMKKRTSINSLLVNTNEIRGDSKTSSTWINHHQTLLREIFGLLKEGTQTQIKQVIRFEDEFLNAAGPM